MMGGSTHDRPAQPIAVDLVTKAAIATILKLLRRPELIETCFREELATLQSNDPFRKVCGCRLNACSRPHVLWQGFKTSMQRVTLLYTSRLRARGNQPQVRVERSHVGSDVCRVPIARLFHPDRVKLLMLYKASERFTGQFCNDLSQDDVVRLCVDELRSWGELHRKGLDRLPGTVRRPVAH